jgi:pilus assembly protein CpaB
MNSRSVITLAVAVVFGLGAMRLSQQLLSGGQNAGAVRDILVAARDLKEEEVLKPEMMKVISMAASAIPPNAFTSFKDVEERWIKTPMLEGDVLTEKKLGPKGTPPGLVSNIPKGMRAFAIDVTEQSGVSGFILPGHHVDVVRYENADRNETRGETILQNVLVLAAGQVFTRPEERSVQSRTVTLAVRPEEVDILVAARAKGALSLALRGVNDHDVVDRPKPAVDPELEKRWQLAEEKRKSLEQELLSVKEQLAKRAEPPAPAPRPVTRIATIYRGLHNMQRVRLDLGGVSEIDNREPDAPEGALASRPPAGFGMSRGTLDGDEPQP